MGEAEDVSLALSLPTDHLLGIRRGLKFDSSGMCGSLSSGRLPGSHEFIFLSCRTRRRDTKPMFPKSERAVFEVLGLEWIDPTLRNADL